MDGKTNVPSFPLRNKIRFNPKDGGQRITPNTQWRRLDLNPPDAEICIVELTLRKGFADQSYTVAGRVRIKVPQFLISPSELG